MNKVVILVLATVAFVGAELFFARKAQKVVDQNPQFPAWVKKNMSWAIPTLLAVDLVTFGILASLLM